MTYKDPDNSRVIYDFRDMDNVNIEVGDGSIVWVGKNCRIKTGANCIVKAGEGTIVTGDRFTTVNRGSGYSWNGFSISSCLVSEGMVHIYHGDFEFHKVERVISLDGKDIKLSEESYQEFKKQFKD